MRLRQINALYEQATHIRFREVYPLARIAQLLANEGGGYFDDSDPLTEPYKTKSERLRKKNGEPRRIPYELKAFIPPWDNYGPLLERLDRAATGSNPYERVPIAIISEVLKALEDFTLPNWFYTSASIERLKVAAGVLKTDE